MKLKYIIIIATLALLTLKCMEQEKFIWEARSSADERYPMYVISGAFYKGEKPVGSLSRADIDNGIWGARRGTGGWEKSKLLPDGMGIEWFSYTENKFYTGSFDLPYDTILQLFQEGCISYRRKDQRPYTGIIAGVAPGGVVIVWVFSAFGKQVEIGRYQAKERTPIDINRFLAPRNRWHEWPDRQAAQDSFARARIEIGQNASLVTKNLAEKGLQLGLWDTYRQKFNLRIRMNYKATYAITDETRIEYYNGEEEYVSLDRLLDTQCHLQPRIKYLETYWSFGRTLKYTEITMDEDEIFAIYNKMYGNNPNREVELRVDVNEKSDTIRLWLAALDAPYPQEVELEKMKWKISPCVEWERHFYTVFSHEYNAEGERLDGVKEND